MGSYNRSRSFLYQNAERTDYISTSWNVGAKFNSHPIKCINLTYETGYTVSLLELLSTGSETSLNDFSQRLTTHIIPSKYWYINLTGEYYNNEIIEHVHKQLVLADIGVTLTWHKVEFNLSLTNIFNKKVYAYRIYDGVSSLYRSFQICPRRVLASIYFQF